MSTDERSIRWYNEHAEEYTAHVRNPEDSIFHSLYEKPAMYDLLPDLQGKSVLSLGCGSGEDCHYLAEQGASSVTGIDISEGMIAIAKDTHPDYDFQVMDMEHLAFPDESFDFVYSSLTIHYLEDWTQVFSEAYRVLKSGGQFLFSCDHPVYSAMEVTRDEEAKVRELSRTRDLKTDTVKIVGDYVSKKPIIVQSDGDMQVTTWHKSIGEISAEAVASGFVIAEIVEPAPLPKMKEVSPKDYETLMKIPNFVIFKLQKPQ